MTDHSEARVEAAVTAAARQHYEVFRAAQWAIGHPQPVLYEALSERTRRLQKNQVRCSTEAIVIAVDEFDRAAGVIRVDTNDVTLIDRLARVLCEVDQADIPAERRETMEQTGSGDDFRDMVRALFAELAAGAQPPPEGG